MGLLNVRLDRDLERKVKALRAKGKVAAEIVRHAINAEYDLIFSSSAPRDLARIVKDIHDRHPDHGDKTRGTASGIRAHIRGEATAFIRGKLLEDQRRIYNSWFSGKRRKPRAKPAQ
jgi:hypothetical protein